MNNPFVIAIKTDPEKFLSELDTPELKAVVEGCIKVLAGRARDGDAAAAPALQSLYRAVANIEI